MDIRLLFSQSLFLSHNSDRCSSRLTQLSATTMGLTAMSLLVLCRLFISVTSTSVFPPALLMLVSQSSSSWQWVCRHSLSRPLIGLCYVRVHLHLCGCSFSFHPNFLPSSIQLQYTDGFIFAWYWWRKRWRLQCPDVRTARTQADLIKSMSEVCCMWRLLILWRAKCLQKYSIQAQTLPLQNSLETSHYFQIPSIHM